MGAACEGRPHGYRTRRSDTFLARAPACGPQPCISAFEFVLTLESFAEGVSPAIERLEISIDMPDRIENADDVTCPVGGLSVTYDYPFLIGPAVAITPQGMLEGDDWEFTAKTQSGFGIRFFNWSAPSTDIERTFDWIAKGAGIELG